MADSVEHILERVEGGPGRRDVRVPVKASYSLRELLPQRSTGYTIPGDMGPALARAFERAFSLLDRGHGPLAVQAPSKILTPRWHRILNHLRRLGLAQTIQLSLPLEKGVPLYYFDIGSPFHAHRTDGARPELPRYSRGFSEDYDLALSKCVGECLERGPLLYFRMADMLRGSARGIRSRGLSLVEPSAVSVFSAGQRERRPETRFDDDSVFRWTRCTSLVTGGEAWAPSQLIYWNYPIEWGDVPEPMLRECSTHGAGGFFSVEGALLSGALECVQRDGFFVHWLRRVVPPRIDVDTVTRPTTVALIEKARLVGLEPVFLDITTELGIPTCLCVLLRPDGEHPYASMGGSCRLDGETAIHDALLEAASVHHIIACDTSRLRLPNDYEPFTDPTLYTHKRLAFWANPEHAVHLAFFLEGRRVTVSQFGRGSVASSDPRRDLSAVTDVLRRHGMDAWYYQAQHPALTELGYASVRVIVPGLVPLYYEERNAPLGHPRLQTAPLYSRAMLAEPWNHWPHPFP
jgi:ribosomal protein S12 methylthiotransferase accessory factor